MALRTHLGSQALGRVHGMVAKNTALRRMIDLVVAMLSPVEAVAFSVIEAVPCRVRHVLLSTGFKFLVGMMGLLPERWTRLGINDELSLEAHALTLAMWPLRLVPVSLRAIRFGLGCGVETGFPPPSSSRVRRERIELQEQGVRGIYLHTSKQSEAANPAESTEPTEGKVKVLMFVFGGAFFGGSARANIGVAAEYARLFCAGGIVYDAFLVDYRRCPEHTIDDAIQDTTNAYSYLIHGRGVAPEDIVVLGISSGGGLALRMLQLAAEATQSDATNQLYFGGKTCLQPAACMMLAPFVDWSDDSHSLKTLHVIDPIVNTRVYEFIQPKMATACGGEDRYGTWRIYTGALFRTAGSNTDPSRLPTGARRCRR